MARQPAEELGRREDEIRRPAEGAADAQTGALPSD